jgi:hypothetical protein
MTAGVNEVRAFAGMVPLIQKELTAVGVPLTVIVATVPLVVMVSTLAPKPAGRLVNQGVASAPALALNVSPTRVMVTEPVTSGDPIVPLMFAAVTVAVPAITDRAEPMSESRLRLSQPMNVTVSARRQTVPKSPARIRAALLEILFI